MVSLGVLPTPINIAVDRGLADHAAVAAPEFAHCVAKLIVPLTPLQV